MMPYKDYKYRDAAIKGMLGTRSTYDLFGAAATYLYSTDKADVQRDIGSISKAASKCATGEVAIKNAPL